MPTVLPRLAAGAGVAGSTGVVVTPGMLYGPAQNHSPLPGPLKGRRVVVVCWPRGAEQYVVAGTSQLPIAGALGRDVLGPILRPGGLAAGHHDRAIALGFGCLPAFRGRGRSHQTREQQGTAGRGDIRLL